MTISRDLEEYRRLMSRSPEEIEEERRQINLKKELLLQSKAEVRTKRTLEESSVVKRKYTNKTPTRYKAYIQRANKRGVKFNITLDEFTLLLKGSCVYCGSYSEIAIDRIDRHDDYNINNVCCVCKTCITMKSFYSHEQFLRQVKKIHAHIG
jgi:hypothetical protein